MKSSQMAAKLLVRLFFILLLITLLPFLTGHADALHNVYLNTNNKWAFVAPILLIVGFIILFVLSARTKYQHPDLNWLLILNIVILIVYGITVFIRIRQLTP